MSIFPVERPAHYKVQRQGCAALWSPPVHSLVEKGDSNDWKCLRSVGEERWVTFSSHSCSFCWLGWIFFTSWQSLWSFPVSSKVKRSEHLQSFPTRAICSFQKVYTYCIVFLFPVNFCNVFFCLTLPGELPTKPNLLTPPWWFHVPGLTANNEAAQVGAFEANAMGTICHAMASELVRKPKEMDPWMVSWSHGNKKPLFYPWENNTFRQK